jgi:predicted lipoprotein with Yx(FWY)xxD motif
MRTSGIRFVAIAAVATFALAACSSSSKPAASPSTNTNATTTTAGATTTAPAASGPATISLVTHGKFGKIMVDSKGMTLYEDENDKPGKPACTGGCLTAWPPVVAPASPTYGPGLQASTFSVVTLADGTKQLAANGFPLYTWMNDKKPGDATGQGIAGFYSVQASGKRYDPPGG